MPKAMYDLRNDEKEQARTLATWAERKVRLSATHTDLSSEQEKAGTTLSNNPVAIRYADVRDKEYDLRLLKDRVQIHKCNGYCMRESSQSDKRKYCEAHGIAT